MLPSYHPSRYAVCSVLHLVELRSQFAHSAALDTLKRNRDYVMQAYGAWFAPRPVLSPPMARAVRLPRALLAATGKHAPELASNVWVTSNLLDPLSASPTRMRTVFFLKITL